MEKGSYLIAAIVCWSLVIDSVLTHDHTQSYCRTREPERCCQGRDDQCTVPRRDTLCYCDMFCARHLAVDCCPDFEEVCMDGPGNLEGELLREKKRD